MHHYSIPRFNEPLSRLLQSKIVAVPYSKSSTSLLKHSNNLHSLAAGILWSLVPDNPRQSLVCISRVGVAHPPSVVVLWSVGVDWRDGIVNVSGNIKLVVLVPTDEGAALRWREEGNSDVGDEGIGNLERFGNFEVAAFEDPGHCEDRN